MEVIVIDNGDVDDDDSDNDHDSIRTTCLSPLAVRVQARCRRALPS